jgi:hypothetical protein
LAAAQRAVVRTAPLTIAIGLLLLVATMHLARGVGRLHAPLAKHLLVKA